MAASEGSAEAAWREVVARGGQAGALAAELDWSATPLGPVAGWPQSLRTAVGICLTSRFPLLVWWSDELVMVYNDAYRPILGASKHPGAMGAPGRLIWPEIWDVIGPMLEGVLRGDGATWSDDQLLILDRNGYLEECYFTFSYSPILDESGGIGGVFTAVTETTDEVVGTRRLQALGDLTGALVDVTSIDEVAGRTMDVLAGAVADVPFAELHVVDGHGHRLAGRVGAAVLPAGGGTWPLDEVLASTEP
ncbi:MAG TPA: hypothetical protein VK306_07710, partial [Acidimicrobiales bacterium]|nr:hypothetical protein [Acidimicrobiales bacterium]